MKIQEYQSKIKIIQKDIDGAKGTFTKIENELETVVSKLSGARQDNRESASQKNMQLALGKTSSKIIII